MPKYTTAKRLRYLKQTKTLDLFCFDHIEIHPLPENPVEHFFGSFKESSTLTRALLKERKENLKREGKKGREIGLELEGSGLDKAFVGEELCSKLS